MIFTMAKQYVLTSANANAISLRPVLAPSGMGGVTVPWANIASVTTHLGSVVVRTNNRRITYRVNRGASADQRRLVEETFGLTGLATSTTRAERVADEANTVRLRDLLADRETEKAAAKKSKAEEKAARKAREEEALERVRQEGGGVRQRFKALQEAKRQ